MLTHGKNSQIMKKYRGYFLMIAIGAAMFCFEKPLVYWYQHPELSEMQLLLAKWPYYLGFILASSYIFRVYLRYGAR